MITLNEIQNHQAVRDLIIHNNFQIHQFQFDSRCCEEGDLFIALKTDKQDGHLFICDAVKNHAKHVMIQENSIIDINFLKENKINIIFVEDTYKALHELATYWRLKAFESVIAITGSNGKTTTKEWLYRLLQDHVSVSRSWKNFNNMIGMPISILNASKSKWLVLELGMNHSGEIKKLAEICRPNIGLITNIGKAHLGHFKKPEDIFLAKIELFDWITENQKDYQLFLNGDDVFLKQYYFQHQNDSKICSFGLEKHNQFRVSSNKVHEGLLELVFDNHEYKLFESVFSFTGKHHIYNLAASLCVAINGVKIKWEDLKSDLSKLELLKHRGEHKRIKDYLIIDDCYNSNPTSMRDSLESFSQLNCSGKKYFICGEMLELGSHSFREHEKIGQILIKESIDGVFTLGNETIPIYTEINKKNQNMINHHADNLEELIQQVKSIIHKNDCVLIKGSRKNQLEKVIERL